MNKHTVVVFTKNNARILKVDDISSFKGYYNAVINPDLKRMRGIPTHHWKISGNSIVSLTKQEIIDREQEILENGIDNAVSKSFEGRKSLIVARRWYKNIIYMCAGVCLLLLVQYILN